MGWTISLFHDTIKLVPSQRVKFATLVTDVLLFATGVIANHTNIPFHQSILSEIIDIPSLNLIQQQLDEDPVLMHDDLLRIFVSTFL